TGVTVRRLERLAREFAEGHPSIAIIGGPPLAQTNGLFNAVAVNALNALAGSVGEPGGLFFTPQIGLPSPIGRQPADAGRRSGAAGMESLAAGILAAGQSPVQALLVDGVNP